MNRKVTVVGGAGNVGATVARGVAEKQLADVVVIDIADQKAAGVALVNLERASEQAQRALRAPSLAVNSGASAPNTPVTLYVSRTAAEAMLGRSPSQVGA